MLCEPRAIRRLGMATVALIGCASLACTTAQSSQTRFESRYWSSEGYTGQRITTAHFEIFSTVRDSEFEAGLPAFLEAAYLRYQATLPSDEATPSKLTMYLFGTRQEWERFTRRRFPTRYPVYSRIRTGGFTEGDLSVSFFRTRASALATLAHEGWHQYVGARFDTRIPAWLNEGLACCHEAIDCAGPEPRFTPRHNTFRVDSLREAVRRDSLMSLTELTATDAGQIIAQHPGETTQMYYSQAWALVTFLKYGARGRYAPAFDRLLSDVADGTFQVRVSAARLAAPNPSTVTLGEAALLAYLNKAPQELDDEYYDHLVRVAGF